MYLQNITKRFLKDNKELIEEDKWEEILIKASHLFWTDNFPIEEIISLIKEVDRAKYNYAPYKIGDEVRILSIYKNLSSKELSNIKPWINNNRSKENLKNAIEDASSIRSKSDNIGSIIDIVYSKDNPFIYLVKVNDKIFTYPFQNLFINEEA